MGKRTHEINVVKKLKEIHNDSKQLICFLSGPGGTGKSKVINAVIEYCQKLCAEINMKFTKRTIVVTALTGAAAVSIFGETTHAACHINGRVNSDHIDEWSDTYLVIVDEISFASEDTLKKLNKNLNLLRQMSNEGKYGGLPIVFSGDFTQLEPVIGKPIFLNTENELWYGYVNTFIELRTNHRFGSDPEWGMLLQKMRKEKLHRTELEIINKRVVCGSNKISENDIPSDAVYATKTNQDKASINEGIFAKFVSETHDDVNFCPMHTICIKASNIMFKKYGTTNFDQVASKLAKDIFIPHVMTLIFKTLIQNDMIPC